MPRLQLVLVLCGLWLPVSRAALRGGPAARKGPRPATAVHFELFTIQNVSVLRVEVPTTVGGRSYKFLLDTGSASIGICPGQAPEEGAAFGPLLSGTRGQWAGCIMYGSSAPYHGFFGHAFGATVQVGSLDPVRAPVIAMAAMRGEQGNACGKPGKGSVRAEELDGIFGFGFQGANDAFCPPQASGYDVSAIFNGSEGLVCPSGCNQSFADAWQQMLRSQPAEQPGQAWQWGLAWGGRLGADTGALFAGADAAAQLEDLSRERPGVVQMEWTSRRCGGGACPTARDEMYSFRVHAYELEGADGEALAERVPVEGEPCGIFDSGTPFTYFPETFVDPLAEYVESLAPGRSAAIVVRTDGAPFVFNVTKKTVELVERNLFALPVPVSSLKGRSGCFFGLPTLIWYEYFHFNFAGNSSGGVFTPSDRSTLSFVPRREALYDSLSAFQ